MIPNFGQNTNRLETNLTERIKIHENASATLHSLKTQVIPKKFGNN